MPQDSSPDGQHTQHVAGDDAPHDASRVLGFMSPAHIKEEPLATPQAASPAHNHESDYSTTVLHPFVMKVEHGTYAHSPLRESSLPVPSTEMASSEAPATKKRPAPVRNKKGTATATKKEPAMKKRKLESKRSNTPLSAISKSGARKVASGKGTPLNASPVPSTRSASVDAEEGSDEEEEDGDGEEGDDDSLYCICRKPDTGTFMIGCDGKCDDWFHGKCMGISERDKNLIDKYICPKCTKAGVGMTTWKRMCRRAGCRQPARVGKNSKEGSKYCSEECGVLFFRSMIAQTRDSADQARSRASRRKTDVHREDEDLGARGGVLASGEVKTLLNAVNHADDFRRLGDGVLSPPSSPDRKTDKHSIQYTSQEAEALAQIAKSKDDARSRHQLLKDRLRFATLVKQAATRTAAEKDLKPKEYCGYDSRIEWPEERFAQWRDSTAGKDAFDEDVLAPPDVNTVGDVQYNLGEESDEPRICDRRKCARHLEWNKLALDDIRFEMSDNSDNMRALDREERSIKERAAMRSRSSTGDEQGSVEVHEIGPLVQDSGSTAKISLPTPPPNMDASIVENEVEMGAQTNGHAVEDTHQHMEIEMTA